MNSMIEIQSCSEFQPPSSCALPRIYFIDNDLSCGQHFIGQKKLIPYMYMIPAAL